MKFFAFAAAALVAVSANAQALYMTGASTVGAEEGGLPAQWDPETPAEFAIVDGNFELEVKGLQQFKISQVAGDWDTFNGAALTCEYGEEQGVTVDLVAGDANILCPWEGDWKVVVAGDLSTIVMTTDTPKPEGGIQLYLRGDMNGWLAPEEWMFEQVGDNYFKLVCGEGMAIAPGDTFKVADAGWTKYNFGYPEALLLEVETELDGGNDPANMTLEEEWNGVCWFSLDGNWVAFSNDLDYVPDFIDPEQISGVAGVEVSEDAAPVYYNLQGVRVANPANGIYVVVKGGKSYKAVVK